MANEQFKLIKEHDKGERSSYYTRTYLHKGMMIFCHNNRVAKSKVINKLVEEFLLKNGYIDQKGRVTRERVF